MYCDHAYHLLSTQLTKNHSEIRLSAFQMIEELFYRSHGFRELLIENFQRFLELTVGKSSSNCLYYLLTTVAPYTRWSYGSLFVLSMGGCGLNPQVSHTKDFKLIVIDG